MWRVVVPGGRLAIAVWGSLDDTPGYSAVTSLLARLFGDDVAALLESPYSLGDPSALRALLGRAGVTGFEVQRIQGKARFPSIRAWMHSDVRGWTLGDRLDEEQYERLVAEAEVELSRFVTADGSVQFAHPALIATAQKS